MTRLSSILESPKIEDFLEDSRNQEKLLEKYFLEDLTLDIHGTTRLLKKLITWLEEKGVEVSSVLYDAFNESRLPAESQFGCRYYHLPEGKVLPFFSSRSLLLQSGTTGLCSWPAAWCLAEFANSESGRAIFGERNLLELGCGTGVGGIFTAALLRLGESSQKTVFLTDVHSEVLSVAEMNAKAAMRFLPGLTLGTDSKDFS